MTQATILIIDDDPAVRNSLKFALEVEGFAVRAYPTGAELLREAELPDNGCLVVDYKLPEMNGLDLLSELRRRNIDLPAILITTHPNPAVRDRAALAGVTADREAVAERHAVPGHSHRARPICTAALSGRGEVSATRGRRRISP